MSWQVVLLAVFGSALAMSSIYIIDLSGGVCSASIGSSPAAAICGHLTVIIFIGRRHHDV